MTNVRFRSKADNWSTHAKLYRGTHAKPYPNSHFFLNEHFDQIMADILKRARRGECR